MAKNQLLHIQPLGFEASVEHAARELQNYLPQLAPVHTHILPPVPALPQEARAQIVAGSSQRKTRYLGWRGNQHRAVLQQVRIRQALVEEVAQYRKQLRSVLEQFGPWIDPLVESPVSAALNAVTRKP